MSDNTTSLSYLLLRADTAFMEFWLGFVALGWACVLLVISPALFVTNPIYGAMTTMGPQWAWGAAFTVLGVTRLYGLRLGARVRTGRRQALYTWWVRFVAALLGTFLWTSLAATLLLYAFGNIERAAGLVLQPAVFVYVAFCVASILIVVRRVQEPRGGSA